MRARWREELHDLSRPLRAGIAGSAQSSTRSTTWALFVSSGDTPPKHLDGARRAKLEQPALLIAAPNSPNGEQLNRVYAEGSKAELWEIPESKHVQGIKARPAEYERRVVGFFDTAL